MTELAKEENKIIMIEGSAVRTRSPYKRTFDKEILPIIRENLEKKHEVIVREEHIKNVLRADKIKSAASLYVRLTHLIPPDLGVSMRTHVDGGKVFSFYNK